jgi:hypothetical protein
MSEQYESLAKAIQNAGFFTGGVENKGTWDRICINSKRRPNGLGCTGNSFWVSRLSSGWYLGTWGGCLYRLPNESRLAELCIRWLTRVPDGTRPDFDEALKRQFDLMPVSEEEFEAAIRYEGVEGP